MKLAELTSERKMEINELEKKRQDIRQARARVQGELCRTHRLKELKDLLLSTSRLVCTLLSSVRWSH